ncbi:SUKH-4 family immunity protein [Streptomyces sp. NPDC102283]|uniref:SUKH-4 family immunity protein n=1 Tax=Streptomyces sp. NPDC102283 TaxID=3366155 RepID=UPI00380BC7E6
MRADGRHLLPPGRRWPPARGHSPVPLLSRTAHEQVLLPQARPGRHRPPPVRAVPESRLRRRPGHMPSRGRNLEILGEFQYATVALDPDTGRVYSFGEGEEFYLPMHSDVSCLAHTVIELEAELAGLKSIPQDDEHARERAVSQLRQRVSDRDSVPFASEESEWSKLFEEIGFGMWG